MFIEFIKIVNSNTKAKTDTKLFKSKKKLKFCILLCEIIFKVK